MFCWLRSIKIFNKKFVNKKEIGREYYEGDYDDMEREFLNIIKNNEQDDNYNNYNNLEDEKPIKIKKK